MYANKLNEIYLKLDTRKRDILSKLSRNKGEFDFTYGYFNGHYVRNESGGYEMNVYPIPVISVQDLCDIEIDLDNVCISTKLSKQNALSFNYDKVAYLEFEVFGVEDYLTDYYLPGEEISTLLQKIRNSEEIEIAYSFIFDESFIKVCDFLVFLKQNQFYY